MAPRTKEELDALAVLDPEIDAIMKSGRFPNFDLDISNGFEAPLAALRTLEKNWPAPPPVPEVNETTRTFKSRDGAELNLFVFSGTDSKPGPKPLVIYFHGGGAVLGYAYSVAALARDLVRDHDCVVISPQYRLAPESPFPTGMNDGWDAFEYITTHTTSLHADIDLSQGLIVGGSSQGAVQASLIALRAKEISSPAKITGLFFAAGSFISLPETIPEKYKDQYISRDDERCQNAPLYSIQAKRLFEAAYQPDFSSPLHRALNNTPLSKHADLASKIYFSVCGADMLRDDSFIYAQILEELSGGAGDGKTEVKVDVFEGAPHVFWTVFGMTSLGNRWKEDTKKAVSWLLGRAE